MGDRDAEGVEYRDAEGVERGAPWSSFTSWSSFSNTYGPWSVVRGPVIDIPKSSLASSTVTTGYPLGDYRSVPNSESVPIRYFTDAKRLNEYRIGQLA